MGLVTLVNEMGLGSVIVQKVNLAREVIEKILGLLILVNIVFYIFIYFSAPYIATFFEEPTLAKVLRVVGIELLLGSFVVIPDSILTRDMKFQYIAVIGFIRAIAASVATLILALLDYGVWALVLGNIIGVVVQGIALNVVVRQWYMPSFSFRGMKKEISFGGLVTTDRILWYLYSESDTFIIGKFLGKELLGIYTVARQLAALPSAKIAQVLSDIAFSAFSRIQEDSERVTRYFLKSVRVMSFVSFAIFIGIASVASEIVHVFLGEKWLQTIIPLQLLSMALSLRMLESVIPSALMGLGRPDINVKNQMIACVIMPIGVLVGVNWGLKGVCIAWVLVYSMYFLIMLYRSLPVLGVTVPRYLTTISGAFLCSLIMYLCIHFMRMFLDEYSATMLTKLIVLVLTGASVYLACALILQRHILVEIQELVRPN
jgi:O-antigen/teichoic acid export membrane protein